MAKRSIESVGKDWGWVLAAGVALILIGIVTMNWPVSSTVGLTFALGILLVATGLTHGIYALQTRPKPGNGGRWLQSLIAVVAGALILRYPGPGMEGVAICLAFYLLINCAVRGTLALGLRPVKGWSWVFFSAVVSGLMGAYVLVTLPISALWIPGFVFGVDLLVYGASLVGIAFDLKLIHHSVTQIPSSNWGAIS